MRFSLLFLAFMMMGFGSAFAQTPPGTIELSTSPTLEVVDDGTGDSDKFLFIPIRFAPFLTEGLQFETEIGIFVPNEGDFTGAVVFLNGAYNFLEDSNLRPFVLAGIGFGNAVRIAGLASDVDETVLAFDFGGGLKAFLNKHVAFRAEYRFERSSFDRSGPGPDVDVNVHKVMFGFSVVLNNG